MHSNNDDICPHCGSSDLFTTEVAQDVICRECAAVLDTNIVSHESDVLIYDHSNAQEVARQHYEVLPHSSSLLDPHLAHVYKLAQQHDSASTQVNYHSQSSSSNSQQNCKPQRFSESQLARRQLHYCDKIDQIVAILSLPDHVAAAAKALFARIIAALKASTRFRPHLEPLALVSIYLSTSAVTNSVSRTPAEFLAAANTVEQQQQKDGTNQVNAMAVTQMQFSRALNMVQRFNLQQQLDQQKLKEQRQLQQQQPKKYPHAQRGKARLSITPVAAEPTPVPTPILQVTIPDQSNVKEGLASRVCTQLNLTPTQKRCILQQVRINAAKFPSHKAATVAAATIITYFEQEDTNPPQDFDENVLINDILRISKKAVQRLKKLMKP